MSADNHKDLARRYIEEVWNDGKPAAPFFAPHYKRYITATAHHQLSQRLRLFTLPSKTSLQRAIAWYFA